MHVLAAAVLMSVCNNRPLQRLIKPARYAFLHSVAKMLLQPSTQDHDIPAEKGRRDDTGLTQD